MFSRYAITIKAVLSFGLLILLGTAFPNPESTWIGRVNTVAHANPASVYCNELGYEYKIVETTTGVVGVCLLPGGLTCDEWDFLSGECGAEYSACAREGYKLVMQNAGESSYSQKYAVCIDLEGKKVGTVEALTNLGEKAASACQSTEFTPPTEESKDAEDTLLPEEVETLPTSFDWRTRPGGNFMTSVKDQGQCGSCWAFSAVGVTEAAFNIANNNPGNNYNLSEEYLVSDCLTGNSCCGGSHSVALSYIHTSGVSDDACMPYVDGAGCSCSSGTCDANCTYNSSGICSDRKCADRCSNWSTRLKKLSAIGAVSSAQSSIKSALINKGPLSAVLRMSGSFDPNGIYRCSPDTPVNHAVTIVGYNDTGGYWTVKNSWGATWNSNGYFMVGYGECSIESSVYYATVTNNIPIPTTYLPSGDTYSKKPTYTWSRISGASSYYLRVIDTTSSTTVISSTISNSHCSTTTNRCNYTPNTILTTNHNYKWRVAGRTSSAMGPYSTYRTFKALSGFNSSFNGSSASWIVQPGGYWAIYDNIYYYTKGEPNHWSSSNHTGNFTNFTFEAKVKRSTAGSANSNTLIVRGTPTFMPSNAWRDGYFFQYSNNGQFSVWKSVNGNWSWLQDWVGTTAIKQNAWNTLKVIADGINFRFYINGTLVWSGTDSSFASGRVGFMMYRYTSAETLYVDWAKLGMTQLYMASETPMEVGQAGYVSDPTTPSVPWMAPQLNP